MAVNLFWRCAMKSKNKGATTAAMTLLITSGMLASVLGVRQVNSDSQVPAWVINKNIAVGQVISVQDISQRNIDTSDYPNLTFSIQNPRALVGKKLAVDKGQHQLIFANDLVRANNKNLSAAIPAGRVLYTLNLATLNVPLSRIHQGDRLDIVAKMRGYVRTIAGDVQLIGVSKSSVNKSNKSGLMDSAHKSKSNAGPIALALAVLPEDVYSLAALELDDNVSIIVHSAYDIKQGRVQKFERLQVNRTIELVKGIKNEAVIVAR